jgi:hypothetical protein
MRLCGQSELTRWDRVADAREVAQMLPCGPRCEREHVVAWRGSSGAIASEFCQGGAPRNGLAAELLDAGYAAPPATNPPVRCWPRPPSLNPPMTGARMTPEEQEQLRAQAAAIAAVGDRGQLSPHPGGLPGRIADAHREAEEALAAGDIDGAIGADMLAAALTDAALAEADG